MQKTHKDKPAEAQAWCNIATGEERANAIHTGRQTNGQTSREIFCT